ncbi:MAG TPA: efflux RND transporter permease subunit [Phycisphaerales bacterium]|nr:efflux RND transporter permease subunit [Phycisphaerales bacterium]
MNLTGFSLRNPYAVVAMVMVVAALGVLSLLRTPTDLFPNTVPPQVAVITVRPGAAAGDVADKITRVLEKELNTLDGLVKVASTTRDEVSSINVEFDYDTSIGQAVLDVQNAIGRVRADLPTDIFEPRIFKVTDATRPLATLALSPRPDSPQTLSQIRLLAENQIKDQILALPGIADVEVFGGHQPEVQVRINRDRLAVHGLTLPEVVSVLAAQNVAAPAGTMYSEREEHLVKIVGEFESLEQIRNLPLRLTGQGLLRVRDVADVRLSVQQPRSLYHGNGKPAIAVNILRPDDSPTVEAIRTFKEFLPKLEARYPDIVFEITDDQQPLIDVNVRGMQQSLGQAVIITVIVIFVFLADARAAAVVAVSIPLSFLGSLMVLSLSPFTLNMVTLSGLIIAVGMVVDASVVVLENIYRHWQQMDKPDAVEAARVGTNQVALEITAGMLTTVVVLVPVAFTGGYTQQVMRPLNLMIVTTLVASLLSALTVVPLTASWLLKRRKTKKNILERFFGNMDHGVGALAGMYVGLLRWALRHKAVTLLGAAALFIATVRIVVPLVGGELMPPMDTGISMIEFETPTEYAPAQVENVLSQAESVILATPGVKMVSSVVGSEAGQISFGGGGATAQTAKITVHLIDRTQRSETIWQIQDAWREQLTALPGVRSSRINEYGATPMATTKAPLNIIVSGPDSTIVSSLADECLEALDGLPGLVDVRRSWYFDKVEHMVRVDPALARLYQTSPAQVADELKIAVKGVPASMMRLEGMLDIPIHVQYAQSEIQYPDQLEQIYVSTSSGPLPLRAMAQVQTQRDQPFVTREHLRNTLDITAVNRVYTIKQVAAMVKQRLLEIEAPEGYHIEVAGTVTDMARAQKSMVQALAVGLVLLYILLMATFKSLRHPITILAAIPLAVAGALWGLLLFDKPMCQPAMMGLILLGGTVVNNSILMLGFILKARQDGMARDEAIVQSVRLRIRPILMTTVSTVLGLTPLVLELAIGLERMSPLGIAAASGLLVGTFLTMVIIPVVYASMDTAAASLKRRVRPATTETDG